MIKVKQNRVLDIMYSQTWCQFSHGEILSMHGFELDEIQYNDTEMCEDENESIMCQDDRLSLDSLGMSFRDFL